MVIVPRRDEQTSTRISVAGPFNRFRDLLDDRVLSIKHHSHPRF